MEDLPYNCGKLTIVDDGFKGWGVEATEDISSNTIIEKCAFVMFPRITNFCDSLYDLLNTQGFLSEKEKYIENLRTSLKFRHPRSHYFKWNAPAPLNGEVISFTAISLGYGSLYNSSNTNNNIGWTVGERLFTFTTTRDIKKGEKLESFYGYFLDQNGTVFNCPSVFNLALDYEGPICKLKAIRFADPNDFEMAKSNPSYARLAQLLTLCKGDGLAITKIVGLAPNGEEKAGFDVAPQSPMSLIYQKIAEFKQSPFPLIKINFEYTDKNDSLVRNEAIIFKK
jgi:hypothetical protein